MKEDAWPQARMWENEEHNSSKRSLNEGEGIPKQECLVLNNTAYSTQQLKNAQESKQKKSNNP